MSSTSTTWTTDTNTKSGVVQIYESNVSVLKILGIEGGNSILELFADQGDDNADKWRMWVNASDDDLHFANYTSGAWADLLTIQDGGNVGIGTAAPAEELEVEATDDTTIKIESTASNSRATLMLKNDAQQWLVEVEGAVTDNFRIRNGTTGSTKLSIMPSGNVGIGTTAPATLLHLYSEINSKPELTLEHKGSAGNHGANLVFKARETNGFLNDNTQIGDILFYSYDNTGNGGQYLLSARIMAVASSGQAEDQASAKLKFYTNNNTTDASTRMTIDETGNVGIGTTDPSAILDISKDASGGNVEFIRFTQSTDTDHWHTIKAEMNGATSSSNRLEFWVGTSTNNTPIEVMTLRGDGNVGIGTTDPKNKLQVAGSIALEVDHYISNNVYYDGGWKAIANSTEAMPWRIKGETDGRLAFYNGSVNTTAGASVSENNVMNFSKTGNVGIGTTSPDRQLEILNDTTSSTTQGGSLRLTSDDGAIMATTHRLGYIEFVGARAGSNATKVGAYISATADGSWSASDDYGNPTTLNFYTQSAATGSTTLGVTTPRMVIDTTGSVGIGTATPGAMLEIEQASDGGGTAFLIDNDDTDQIAMKIEAANIDANVIDISTDALTSGGMLYLVDDSPSQTYRNCVSIIQENDAALNATVLYLKSDASGTGMVIDKNYPATLVAADTVKGLHIDFDHTAPESGTATMEDIGIDLDVNSGSISGATHTTYGMDIDVVGSTAGTHTAIGIAVDVGSATTNYAALFNGGNVGIGTTVPTSKLQVGGNVSGETVYVEVSSNTDATSGLLLAVNSAGKWALQNYSDDQLQIYDFADGSVAMHCDTTEEAWGTGSDSRIKENVENIGSILAKLNSLNPITYQRKYSKSDKSYAGLVAQEVLPNFPLVVTGTENSFKEIPAKDAVLDDDGNIIEEATVLTYEGGLSLKYSSFVPYLIKAIQELSAKVTALENA